MSTTDEILRELTENYRQKTPVDLKLAVQFNVEPDGDWYLEANPGKQLELHQGTIQGARFTVLTTHEILNKIYLGQMSPLTASGRAKLSKPAPLDFQPGAGLDVLDVYGEILDFTQRFFNQFDPERILIGEQYARSVHGGIAVALYYQPGFRSAWYKIRKGQQLNSPGDTNPFPQAFIFISGKGSATIGNRTIDVCAGQSYFIPPNEDHIVWTEDDDGLEMLWLAWGKGT